MVPLHLFQLRVGPGKQDHNAEEWDSLGCELGDAKSKHPNGLHPGRLTWNLKITHLERNIIFQTSIIMFHVNLPGCISVYLLAKRLSVDDPCTMVYPVEKESSQLRNLLSSGEHFKSGLKPPSDIEKQVL